jgi:hypothetical protein
VHSGGGLHVYWWLEKPILLPNKATLAKTFLRKLTEAVGAYSKAAEPETLRLMADWNSACTPPEVELAETVRNAYTYAQGEPGSKLAEDRPPQERRSPPPNTDASDEPRAAESVGETGGKVSQATVLVRLARDSGAEFFHDDDTAYAHVRVNGHAETIGYARSAGGHGRKPDTARSGRSERESG